MQEAFVGLERVNQFLDKAVSMREQKLEELTDGDAAIEVQSAFAQWDQRAIEDQQKQENEKEKKEGGE